MHLQVEIVHLVKVQPGARAGCLHPPYEQNRGHPRPEPTLATHLS